MTDKDPLQAPAEATMTAAPPRTTPDEDSDPDFDDLDDVLDQFAPSTPAAPNPKAPSEPTPSASGPGRPNVDAEATSKPDPSEEEFMVHLNAEMSALISNMSSDPAASGTSAADLGAMGKELEQFTERMEKEGVKPEDLLRAILGEEDSKDVIEAANDERNRIEKEEDRKAVKSRSPPATASASTSTKPDASTTTFEDTIRKTMERMNQSDTTARDAANTSANSEEDMLAQLLKAIDGDGAGAAGEDGDLSKMLEGMMEQLMNKDMLYEPMSELNSKFPEWLQKNGSKLPAEDKSRYENQSRIVGEIVRKFEEKGYSDEDLACREFIWERMQKMQAEGSPPEDLISNPFPGMGGGIPGLGGAGDPQCPTQ